MLTGANCLNPFENRVTFERSSGWTRTTLKSLNPFENRVTFEQYGVVAWFRFDRLNPFENRVTFEPNQRPECFFARV